MRTFLHSIFHLNLTYSSIAEKDIPTVIKRCYWPLLRLAERFPKAISIEANGYTLETIKKLDPMWIEKLKELLDKGHCEFIGSGYAQIIGPLVPAEINKKNLKFGNDAYRTILNSKPKIIFVNEQAYGPGLIAHYKNAGFQTMVMEWNNPAHFHPQWNRNLSYYPQVVLDQEGQEMNILWNNSTHFQRFQRYIHGDISLEDYYAYLKNHMGGGRYILFYGSDAEVFDFRPGRFHTESILSGESEWEKIANLLAYLLKQNISFALPSAILSKRNKPYAFQKLHLESVKDPLPVKKQEKYNIVRWGLAGRDAVWKNTACYELFYLLKKKNNTTDSLWKELCFFWSSDFRTHIESRREKKFYRHLSKRLSFLRNESKKINQTKKPTPNKPLPASSEIQVSKSGSFLFVKSKTIEVTLNCRRGLAIENLIFSEISEKPLIRTLPQGYYEDIYFNADYFSGHTAVEVPGLVKITDLYSVTPKYSFVVLQNGQRGVAVTGKIKTKYGTIEKNIFIMPGTPELTLRYCFRLALPLRKCSFRSGNMTFNPEAFDQKSLFFACHNGGLKKDVFSLKENTSNFSPVSLLCSARRVLGNTSSVLEVGDNQKTLYLRTDMKEYAALPIIQFERMSRSNTYFLRTQFSLEEFDDTVTVNQSSYKKPIHFTLNLTAKRK